MKDKCVENVINLFIGLLITTMMTVAKTHQYRYDFIVITDVIGFVQNTMKNWILQKIKEETQKFYPKAHVIKGECNQMNSYVVKEIV